MPSGITLEALLAQLLLGLINGAFYALLSLGLAVIFGLLNVINFAHGALYMLGAFIAWGLMDYAGIGYWPALVIAPIVVGVVGIALERTMLHRLYRLDPLYSLLWSFGCSLFIDVLFRNPLGTSGVPYEPPVVLQGVKDVGFMVFPISRAWVMAVALGVCFAPG